MVNTDIFLYKVDSDKAFFNHAKARRYKRIIEYLYGVLYLQNISQYFTRITVAKPLQWSDYYLLL